MNSENYDVIVVGGGHAGLKLFITENIAISGAFVYEWASEKIYEKKADESGAFKLEESHTTIRFGMRYFFCTVSPPAEKRKFICARYNTAWIEAGQALFSYLKYP